MKAAIVYKMGGAQPIARETFYLLDNDLEKILKDAGLQTGDSTSLAFMYGISLMSRNGYMKDFAEKAKAAVQPHIVKTVTTDFDGTAKFEGIGAGTYYIVGATQTRGGFAVWNLKVEAGDSVVLDQNNAVYSY
jgi:hypothetical protein